MVQPLWNSQILRRLEQQCDLAMSLGRCAQKRMKNVSMQKKKSKLNVKYNMSKCPSKVTGKEPTLLHSNGIVFSHKKE